MYIHPNTNIKILKDIPLDNTYKNTLYWDSKASQTSYFSGMYKYNLTAQTYQRVNKGKIRVQIVSENLYNCNYLMFQNTSFGTRWFYAFITSVEYVNNETSEITFELDVMQNWYFDYSLKECYVEREHSTTDMIGDNIIDESLETGTPIAYSYEDVDLSSQNVAMLCSSTPTGDTPNCSTVNNVFCGLEIIGGLPVTDYLSIKGEIKLFVDKGIEKNIISIFQYPSICGDATEIKTAYHNRITLAGNFKDLDGYVPKNNKLFTYPFNFVIISNNSGSSNELRYEYFDDNIVSFNLDISVLTTTSAMLSPINYRNIKNDYESGVVYSNFPVCAWAGDSYTEYVAQNKNAISTAINNAKISSAVKNVGAGLLSMTGPTGALIGASASIGASATQYTTISQIQAQKQDMKAHPDSAYGQIQCDSLNQALKRTGFRIYKMCLNSQFAKCIDDYFTMFGYSVNRIKVPNRSVRPCWNFTKTVGCNAIGSVPADDLSKICSVYDNGVTFWKSPSYVGNYSLDNSL